MQENKEKITTLKQAVTNAQLNLKTKFTFLGKDALFPTPENQNPKKADNALNFLNPDNCFSPDVAKQALGTERSTFTDANTHEYTRNAIHATWNVLKELEWVLNASLLYPINPLRVGPSLGKNLDYLLINRSTMPVINEDTNVVAQELLSFCKHLNNLIEKEYNNLIMKPVLDKAGFKISSAKELISNLIINLSDQIAQYDAIKNRENPREYERYREGISVAVRKVLSVDEASNFLDTINPNELSLEMVDSAIEAVATYQTNLSELFIEKELQNINVAISNTTFDTFIYIYDKNYEKGWLQGVLSKNEVVIKTEPLKELKQDITRLAQLAQPKIVSLRERLNVTTSALKEQKQALLSDEFKTSLDDYIKNTNKPKREIESEISIKSTKKEPPIERQIENLKHKIDTTYPEERQVYQDNIKHTSALLDTLSQVEQFINGDLQESPIDLPEGLDLTKALAAVSDKKKILADEKEQQQADLNRLILKNAENNLPALKSLYDEALIKNKEADSVYHAKQQAVFKQEIALEQFKEQSNLSFNQTKESIKTQSPEMVAEIEKVEEGIKTIATQLETLEKDKKQFEPLATSQMNLDVLLSFKNSAEKGFLEDKLLEVEKALELDPNVWGSTLSNLNNNLVDSASYVQQLGVFVISFVYDLSTPEKKLEMLIDEKIENLIRLTTENSQLGIVAKYEGKTPSKAIEFIDSEHKELSKQKESLIQSKDELEKKLQTLKNSENETKTALQKQYNTLQANLSLAKSESEEAGKYLAESSADVSKIKEDIARCQRRVDISTQDNEKQDYLKQVDEDATNFNPRLKDITDRQVAIQKSIDLIDSTKVADAKGTLQHAKAQLATLTTDLSQVKQDAERLKAKIQEPLKNFRVKSTSVSSLNKAIKAHKESVKSLKTEIDTKDASVDDNAKKQLRNTMSTLLHAVRALTVDELAQSHDKLLKIDADDVNDQMVLEQGFSAKAKEVIDAARDAFTLVNLVNPKDASNLLTSSLPEDNTLLEPQISATLAVLSQMITKSHTLATVGTNLLYVATALIYKRTAVEMQEFSGWDKDYITKDVRDLDDKAVIRISSDIQLLENNVQNLLNACDAFQLHLKNKISDDCAANPHKYVNYLTGEELDFDKIDPPYAEIAAQVQVDIEKYKVMERMKTTLVTDYKPSEKLETFKSIYDENKELLESNTDSAAVIFLKVVATVLSLFIATPWLWQKESESFTKNVNSFFAIKKELQADRKVQQEEVIPHGPGKH